MNKGPVSYEFYVGSKATKVSLAQDVRAFEKALNKLEINTFVSEEDAVSGLHQLGIPDDDSVRIFKITVTATEA